MKKIIITSDNIQKLLLNKIVWRKKRILKVKFSYFFIPELKWNKGPRV